MLIAHHYKVFGLVYRNYYLMRRQLSGERNTHRRDTLIALLDIIEVLGKVQNYIMKALEYLQDIPTHIHPQPPSIFGGYNSQLDCFFTSFALLWFTGSDRIPRISIDMVLHLHAYKVIRALTQQSEPDVGGHQKVDYRVRLQQGMTTYPPQRYSKAFMI